MMIISNVECRHISRPRLPFWGPLTAILDFAGGERVPPALLGWYSGTFKEFVDFVYIFPGISDGLQVSSIVIHDYT